MAIRKCVVAVPARLQSSRLPNKVLADIGGKPMIQRVLERCREANVLKRWCFAPTARNCRPVLSSGGSGADDRGILQLRQ